MSALPPKADIAGRHWHVRLVPQPDSCTAANSSLSRSPRRRTRLSIGAALGNVHEEMAGLYCSISSSARRTNAWAVSRFMTSSNVVGCCTSNARRCDLLTLSLLAGANLAAFRFGVVYFQCTVAIPSGHLQVSRFAFCIGRGTRALVVIHSEAKVPRFVRKSHPSR
jgi:hypothetical protein